MPRKSRRLRNRDQWLDFYVGFSQMQDVVGTERFEKGTHGWPCFADVPVLTNKTRRGELCLVTLEAFETLYGQVEAQLVIDGSNVIIWTEQAVVTIITNDCYDPGSYEYLWSVPRNPQLNQLSRN